MGVAFVQTLARGIWHAIVIVSAVLAGAGCAGPIVDSGFINPDPAVPSCHASTIVEAADGHLLAAWFAGNEEGAPDVCIWVSRHNGHAWSAPVRVAEGSKDGGRVATWNPVLFQPAVGPLLLFYKVGAIIQEWEGARRASSDGGRTWSLEESLGQGLIGPVKNKPITLPDGTLLCPASTERDGWRVHLELTRDWCASAKIVEPAEQDPAKFGAIQPTVLRWPRGRLQILCRARTGGRVVESWSSDGGTSWSALEQTTLPNPNSGIDGVVLKDGRAVLVYNPTTSGRTPLVVAISADGVTWHEALTLESRQGEYSYPAVVQASDGAVHITYTWCRQRIKHVVLDPTRLR
jgi:predicted neuraminidase